MYISSDRSLKLRRDWPFMAGCWFAQFYFSLTSAHLYRNRVERIISVRTYCACYTHGCTCIDIILTQRARIRPTWRWPPASRARKSRLGSRPPEPDASTKGSSLSKQEEQEEERRLPPPQPRCQPRLEATSAVKDEPH